jgi:hypothetical protein
MDTGQMSVEWGKSEKVILAERLSQPMFPGLET